MSTEYQAPAPPLARKLASGRSFGGTSVYDGVFAGAGKCGATRASSRSEDYAEIFGGSSGDARRSSIPVLQFPGLHERKAAVDVRRSKLDYSRIFGGFGDLGGDVASYEELVNEHAERRSVADGARTQDSMRSSSKLSAGSLNETQVSSHEASYHSRDREKKFNVSYSKVNLETNGETNKKVHITQLGDVPGYAHVIEESALLEQSKGNKPKSVVENGHASKDAGDGVVKANNYEKAKSGVLATGSDKPSTKEGISIQKSDQNRSFSNDLLFDAYEYGFRKEPFGAQTPINVSSNSKKFGVSPSSAFKNAAGVYSPPDFDENVDANSVAAASAAAVKKAIEKAQAKIKVARELMERRKEGLQGHVNFKEKIWADDKRARKMARKANRCSDKEKEHQVMRETDTPAQLTARARGVNNVKPGSVNVESGDEENLASSKAFSGGILQQANKEICADLRLRKVGEEAENSYQAAETKQNASVTIEQQKEGIGCSDKEKEHQVIRETDTPAQLTARAIGVNNVEPGSVNVESGDEEKLASSKAFSGGILQQANKEIRADLRLRKVEEEAENSYQAAETKQNASATIEQQKEGIGVNDMTPSCDEHSSETPAKIDFEKAAEVGYSLTTVEETLDQEKLDENLLGVRGTQEGDKQEVKVQSAQGLNHTVESEIKGEVTLEQEGSLWKFMKIFNPWQYQDKPKELNKSEFKKRLEAQELEENNLRSVGEECDWEGNEMKQIEAHEGEPINAHNHKCEGEMSNGTLKEMSSQEDEALQDTCERLVVEREREETCNPKENDDEHDNFGMGSDSEAMLETLHQQERLMERSHDLVESKEVKGLEEEKEVGDIPKVARADVNEEIHEDTKQMNADAGQQEAFISIETDNMEELVEKGVEDEVEESHESQNRDHNAICTSSREACEELISTQEGDEPNDSIENIDVHMMDEKENEGDERMVEMNSSVREEEDDCSSGSSTDDYDLEKRCKVEASDITCFMLRANETNPEVGEATVTLEFRENYVNLSDAGMSSAEKQNEQDVPESNTIPNLGVPVQGLAPELNNYGDDLNEAEISLNWKEEAESSKSEEVNSDVGSSDKGGSFDDEMTIQPEQINGTFKREERTREAHQSIETSQSKVKIEENHYTTLTMEERISEDCQQKEIGPDKECFKKIDEEKERERAREKERLAVERAIREARERAYAEARERAEKAAVGKATIEARQRVMGQAREKTGKASTETNGKLSEKISVEARLKAERAAVERATAEARERALEKALAEKLSGAGKDRKLRQRSSHDPQHRGSCPSSDSRHPKSSDTNAAGSGEKSEGTNNESAQRRKARLERYQRTAERAEKALAEKNKRDLLAQREQVERNRLAESLDADIKRWSSGKLGNLRALLSTLQYILGPDSGWQPVTLTEIVTTAAVKKAYRKATLCVHPDKLQQRGASLQQKYICEKVFDLLKEAWNKFSSAEER
ncbi:hypothetical protein ACJRO7_023517 [Eucalyptus globulus]|uniref:J domain-containing protein n=1 Tax=Eucalyptus globulus TaxID=34317 RepID=A0ABD3K7Z5_EUCGL